MVRLTHKHKGTQKPVEGVLLEQTFEEVKKMRSKNLQCVVEGCTQTKHYTETRSHGRCRPHLKEYKATYWATHKDEMRQKALAYREENEGLIYVNASDGYVYYVGYAHPACNPSGITRYHRILLWDKLGGKDAKCDECDRQLYWDKMTTGNITDALQVDHVNEDKADNRPENIVPICTGCNTKRARRNKAARLSK